MERFRQLYADNNIHVPHVYNQYTTERELTMEWIDGNKLPVPWLPREAARRLINIGVLYNARYVTLLQLALLHAHSHIGNLLRKPDSNQLVYLHFAIFPIPYSHVTMQCYQVTASSRK